MGHDDDLRHRQRQSHARQRSGSGFRITGPPSAPSTWDSGPTTSLTSPRTLQSIPATSTGGSGRTYGINGAFPYVEAQKSSRQTIQADLSHYAEEFLGQHDIKFGVQYTKGRGNWQGGYFQNYVNFLYPYRWTQSVQYMQDWYGDTGLLSTTTRTPSTRSSPCARPTRGERSSTTSGPLNNRLTVNLGLRFDRMTTKYGVGKVYDFVTSAEEINGPPPVLRDRASTGQHLRLQDLVAARRSELPADGGWQDRRAGLVRPLLPAAQRRDPADDSAPTCPNRRATTQIFEVGPWSTVDTNGDGDIDTVETRDAARRMHGLTPLSEESRTRSTPSWTLNVADNLKDQYTDQFTLNFEREVARNFSFSVVVHLQARRRYLRQHPHQPRSRARSGSTSGSRSRRLSGQQVHALQRRAEGLRRKRRRRWGRRRVDRRQRHVAGPEHAGLRRRQAEARLPRRCSSSLNKRYSDRLAGAGVVPVLELRSASAAARSGRTSTSRPRCSTTTTGWEPQLHGQQPRGAAAVHAQVRVEAVRLVHDSRAWRSTSASGYRMHTGRPFWQLENYPAAHPVRGPAGGVIDPAGLPQIVARRSQQSRLSARAQTLARSALREGLQAGRRSRPCTSSSMGSTSSTRRHHSTSMSRPTTAR